MNQPVILSAVRTPIGKFRGGLTNVRPDDMAALVLRAALERVPESRNAIQEVCFGATNQAGEDNRNVGRMAALLADLPFEVTGSTHNRLCGSGMDAIVSVARGIRCGDFDLTAAGGIESMTRAPFVMSKASEGFSRTAPVVFDSTIGWRFSNPQMAKRIPLESMGQTAENVAERFTIKREAQDNFAHQSHLRATQAWDKGLFKNEVIPVPIITGKKSNTEVLFQKDECIRPNSTVEKLAALKPVFREGGSVTAGNSSPLNDGAAALVIGSENWAKKNNIKPLARIVGWAVAGVDPSVMGTGPIPATRKVLERTGLSVKDIGLIELNEAFAVQALACITELGLDPNKVNIKGGAIALGHPIGCSGARIVVTLAHAMQEHDIRYGLATLCVGVGQGMAMILEKAQ
ncbi:MAG: thiolase family protein [Myxococcales bacterium]|nr:MAG: thiolase family protein [Myxococcales bacterium]